MFNKITLKGLAGIFAILLIIAVIIAVRNNSSSTQSKNRSFKSELVKFDTAGVTQISIEPKYDHKLIELKKTNTGWKLVSESSEYNADPRSIESMLNTLTSLRAKRIAANKKDQWEKFELTDSLATRVIVRAGKKEMVNVLLGKFSYQQPKNANPNPYQQQQGMMTSYVRLEGEKEVYAVDGMIAMSFNRQASDFRNRSLVRSDNAMWSSISVTGPDESYTLRKQGETWMVDGLLADSSRTAKYITSLAYLSSGDFLEASDRRSDTPVYELIIEGQALKQPIRLQAFPADTSHVWAISSSINTGSFFSGKKAGLYDKVFKEKGYFFPGEALQE